MNDMMPNKFVNIENLLFVFYSAFHSNLPTIQFESRNASSNDHELCVCVRIVLDTILIELPSQFQ